MHVPPLLSDTVVIIGLSIAVMFAFNKLKLPTILGFLVVGVIAGPEVLKLVWSGEVEMLAEIGVVLLLFTIGLEFSLTEMMNIRKAVFIGGTLQVGLTILAVYGVVQYFGMGTGEAIFIGFLISLSSTAIVLKLLQEYGQINSPHGRTSLGILIFQDLIVVPMMLFTPMLSGKQTDVAGELFILAVKGIVIILAVFLLARYIMPYLLYQIAKTKSRELFLLSVLVICFAVALVTGILGLSLALGAFLAGVIISESEYSHQAISNIVPFRVLFESFFFVSIGMLLDLDFLIENIWVVLLLTFSTLLLKTIITSIAGFSLRLAPRTIILTALSLCQVGEFAFILSKIGLSEDILTGDTYQYFLSVSIATMGVTPFIFKFGQNITELFLKAPLPGFVKDFISSDKFKDPEVQQKKTYKNHLVVIGYGLNGQNVVKAARYALIPYVILDINADTVKKEREKGEAIFFGDGVNEEILHTVCVKTAKVVVVAISDPVATRRVVANVRMLSSNVQIVVRTRYVNEIVELKKIGANSVITEEFETSIEIFTRVLSIYMIPANEVEKLINVIRADSYEMLRSMSPQAGFIESLDANLSEVNLANLKVPSKCKISGRSLAEVEMRKEFGVTLLAIKRDRELIHNPPGDTKLEENDVLYLFGEPSQIINFKNYIES